MDKLPLNKTPINFRAFPVNDILPTGTVTFLFTDIQDSTPLWESQPEKMAEAMHIHNTVLKHVIQAYEGVIFQTVGDAFCASFPTAFQALNAAVDGQRHLQEARWNELGELKVRMGLHTGEEALDPSGDGYILSHNKNRVARIMSAAYGGQVLLSQETKEFVERQLPEGILLKDLGELRLKGMVRLEHLFQVSAPGLLSDFPPLTTTVQHPHNLPVRLTSFVGRQADVEAVCQLLLNESVRLLTITGVGGTGKTSLALQVGWKLLESFRDGIFFIDLVPINDSSLVLSAIASTLNLHQLPGKPLKVVLAEHLLSRRLLLILDNFEQVLPAGMELVDLMKSAPQVKFIVTSRERLRVSPENQYFLSPFPLPSPDCTLETLRESEAVQLFIDRAQVIQPDLRLTMENGAEIAEICRRLDGLPLAIELIDARLSLFNVPELSKQLSNRLRLLSGGWRDIPSRHHTMRAAIAWSCELLDEEEKNLFYRLAVFPGSFDLEEVEAICGAKGLDIFSGMASLMDKHLVNRQEVDGQPRFWLFETLCEFGLEQLSGSGEMLTLQHCHAAYYAQLSTETGQNYALWDLERPNLRMAFNWAITHQNGELALKLGDNFFAWERQVIEGGQLISKTLSLPGTQAKTSQRGWVLYSASALTLFSRDFPAAKQWLDELEALNQELNNQELTWWAKQLYLFYLAGCGDFEACLRLGLESRAQAGHFAYAQASLHIACSALQIQNEILAKELIQDAKDHYQKVDNPTQTMPYLVDCDTVLGYTALEEHQPGQALEYFRQAFRLALQLSVLPRVGAIYQGLGEVARQSGNFEEGVQWMSLAVTIAKTTGFSSRVVLDKLQKRYLEELKNWVNPSLFKDYWEAGQRLSMGQAITYGEERLLDK